MVANYRLLLSRNELGAAMNGRQLVALLLLTGVGACQDLPQPFRHEGLGPALAIPENTSVADIRAEEAQPVQASASPPAAHHRTTIRLDPMTDLPGDGGRSMHRAMKSALERRGVLVVSEGGDLVAQLHLTQTAGNGGQVKLAFHWDLLSADGHSLGHVDQQGEAKNTEISGPWGGLARLVAEGGADGLVQLVTKLTP